MFSAQSISHTYPSGTQALHHFSLEVNAGEFVAIVGPSGCGKSTLLRILAGLLQPTSGQVSLNGQPITAPVPQIGIMFQEAALLPWRTVAQNVALPLELGREIRDWRLEIAQSPISNLPISNLQSLISLVGLTDFRDAYPQELSGGMAQRVALARALVAQPPVLLLDEPFGALDAFTRESLTQAIENICRAQGTTVILVTHNLNEAVFLADRVIACSPRPAQPLEVVPVKLPRPRAWTMEAEPAFISAVQQTREALHV
jgi:NitT/TauT family transport system ATP-binding protein